MEEDVKVYAYYQLSVLDKLSCVQWARDNYDRFDGNTSPLWNETILNEFKRIKKERLEKWKEQQRISRANKDLADFDAEIETVGKRFEMAIPLPTYFNADDVEIEWSYGQEETKAQEDRS